MGSLSSQIKTPTVRLWVLVGMAFVS